MARPGVRRRAGDDLCCALGRALRARREALGFTQAALAARAHVDQSSVCQWEGGVTTMAARDVLLLAAALGTTAAVLLEEAWDAAAPCTRLAVPGPVARGPGTVRLRPPPHHRPEANRSAHRQVRAPDAPVEAGDLDGLARRLADAGLPAERAHWAAERLWWAAEEGVCQAAPQGTCRQRPVFAAARVDRAGKVFARALCAPHAKLLDHEWAVVGPGGEGVTS